MLEVSTVRPSFSPHAVANSDHSGDAQPLQGVRALVAVSPEPEAIIDAGTKGVYAWLVRTVGGIGIVLLVALAVFLGLLTPPLRAGKRRFRALVFLALFASGWLLFLNGAILAVRASGFGLLVFAACVLWHLFSDIAYEYDLKRARSWREQTRHEAPTDDDEVLEIRAKLLRSRGLTEREKRQLSRGIDALRHLERRAAAVGANGFSAKAGETAERLEAIQRGEIPLPEVPIPPDAVGWSIEVHRCTYDGGQFGDGKRAP